ncbi:MAG: hypothetical protein V8S31_05350 [Lachnospiraceae bacterium]
MDTEYQAGVEMGKYFADKGIKTVAVYGAFIPNPMHVYRVAGVLSGLGLSYGGATEEADVVGQIFADQSLDLSKITGDIQVVSYLQGMEILQRTRSMQLFRQIRRRLSLLVWQQHFLHSN